MGRRKSGGKGKPVAAAYAAPSGFLEQLNQLREFVAGAGLTAVSEDASSDCLRACGHNVQRAAEMLLTGEYFANKQKAGGRSSNFVSLVSSRNTDKSTSMSNVVASSKKPPPAAAVAATQQGSKRARKKESPQPRATKAPPIHRVSPEQATKNDNDKGQWLLCQRWFTGSSTTIRGSTSHTEELRIEAEWRKDSPTLSFVGRNVRGRFPNHMEKMMVPLLREKKTSAESAPEGPQLIRVECKAMVNDPSINTLSQIPLTVSVWLGQPEQFFQLFCDNSEAPMVSNKMFFDKQKKKARKISAKASGNLFKAQAAFSLLQWAQYGDELPDFAKPRESSDDGKEGGGGDTREDEEEIEEMEEEESNAEMLKEDDFEDEASTAEGEELTSSIAENDEGWAASLPEAKDPPGFVSDIQLRPYQKQALHWMNMREVSGESREQQETQLEILRELASWQQQRNEHSQDPAHVFGADEDVIKCDCGPVVLSEKAKKRSRTLDGQTDPLSHPLWSTRYLASKDGRESRTFYVNELMGVATHVTPNPPKPCSGGILADAMGLGKTVMILSLILQRKCEMGETTPGPRTTLIVAKLSLLPQWIGEIESKTNLSCLRYYGPDCKNISIEELGNHDVVLTTYGTIQGELNRKNPVLSKMSWLRVVLDEAHCIRNQQTLASKVCSRLSAEHRWCVSGTIIQNSVDDVFGLMKFLHHEPWSMPSFWKQTISSLMQTNDELGKEEREANIKLGTDRVRRILKPLMLRRTKDSLVNGKPILSLPQIETKTISVELKDGEREFYNALLARSAELFTEFVGRGTVAKQYFQILSLINRLRQACDHISLTVRNRLEDDTGIEDNVNNSKDTSHETSETGKNEDGIGETFLENLCSKFLSSPSRGGKKRVREVTANPNSEEKRPANLTYEFAVANKLTLAVKNKATQLDEECPICLNNPRVEDAVLTQCAHTFCKECLVDVLRSSAPEEKRGSFCPDGVCPSCQRAVSANKIITVTKFEDGSYGTSFLAATKVAVVKKEPITTRETSARLILRNSIQSTDSSKLVAVVDELHNVWGFDPGSKVVVFSQYLGFLDILEVRLKSEKIPMFRLDGSMRLEKRMGTLQDFNDFSERKNVTNGKNDSNEKRHQNINNSTSGSVLLMSMTAGAEGLNLCAASSVFIVDPWWNSAREEQCIHRIHRIGQQASQVRVRKFVVDDSVEERMIQLQQRKKSVSDVVFGGAEGGEAGSARLALEDFKLIFQH